MVKNLILFVLLLAPSAKAQPIPNEWPLKVGIIVPLTGPLAEYGVAFNNGLELAKTEAEEISRNCSFTVEDSKYDSRIAVGLFQKLSSVDRTPIVFNWGGPTSEAVSPLAERNGVALFVWSVDPQVSQNRPHVIRFTNSGLDYAVKIADFLKNRGYRKIGIVKTDNQYIDAILSGFNFAAGTSLQIEVIDNYQPGDQDFKTTVSKIKGRSLDALGVFLLSGQVSQFAKQLKYQSVDFPLFGTDFFESMTEVNQANGGLNGAVFANNEVSPKFLKSYVSRFGNDLQINHAANGYDFAKFLCIKLGEDLKGLSPAEIVKRACAISAFESEQGRALFTISDRGDKYFKFPVVIRRIGSTRIATVN